MAQAYKGKRVQVEILTDTYRIWGTLFLPLAGEGASAGRLSDFLNNPEKTFIALTEVEVEELGEGKQSWTSPFVALNKSVVTMVRAVKE